MGFESTLHPNGNAALVVQGQALPVSFGHRASARGAITPLRRDPRIVPSLDVLDAELDAALCVGGAPWDYAPLVVLVEEAGGRYADAEGGRRIDTGCALFTNGGPVHARILEEPAAERRGKRAPGSRRG